MDMLTRQRCEGVIEADKNAEIEELVKSEVLEARKSSLKGGGLFVVGTERHESRRIDNQLRGRSGRQGDPGASRFFLSLEDDLMRIFGSERMDGMLQKLGLEKGEAIVHRWINKALEKAIAAGSFREDLHYRLNVFSIFMPALRDRKPDILLLADHFTEKYASVLGRSVRRISTPAIDMLMSYHWPGNVRELENCIERAVILSTDGVVHGHHLPPTLQTATKPRYCRSSD